MMKEEEKIKIAARVNLKDITDELSKGPEHISKVINDLGSDVKTLCESMQSLYNENIIINNFCGVKITCIFEALGNKLFEIQLGTSCKTDCGDEFGSIRDILDDDKAKNNYD